MNKFLTMLSRIMNIKLQKMESNVKGKLTFRLNNQKNENPIVDNSLSINAASEKNAVITVKATEVNKSTDYSEIENSIVRVGMGEIIDYVSSNRHKNLIQGIKLDIDYLTERSAYGINEKEKLLMLADLIINYKGKSFVNHLYWFKDKKVLNGRICDIPLTAFAKLNSQEIVSKLILMGAEDISTKQSQSTELVESIAQLFSNEEDKRTSIQDTISTIIDLVGLDAQNSYKQ